MSVVSLSGTLVLTFFISAVAALACYTVRRPPHPLSFPPGPRGLPFFGSVFEINTLRPWLTFTQWASSYGDMVYCTILGRQFLIIQSTDTAKALLDQRSSIYSDRPPVKIHDDLGSEFNSALLRYGDRWRLHRRVLHQSFRAEASRVHLPTQLRKIRQLLINVYDSPGSYQRQIELFASGVIMSAVYDYETLPDDDPLVLAAERAIDVFVKVAGLSATAILEAFPFLLKLPVWFPGAKFKRMAIRAKSNLYEMIDVPFHYARDRVISRVSKPCMISDSLKRSPKCDSEGFELALKSASATAFIAGVETTASALIVFVLAMMRYPVVQERAQNEINAVVGSHKLPDFKDRPSLPYTEAIVRETLRWCPIFPLCVSHYTTKSDVYNGYYIPKGCAILANVWAMLMDEVKYPNPTEFIPERFFKEDGELNDDLVGPAFGFGRRVCVGRYFADASLWIAIVHLLFALKFMKSVDKNGVEIEPDPEWSTGLILHPLKLKCRVVPRFTGVDADNLIQMILSSD